MFTGENLAEGSPIFLSFSKDAVRLCQSENIMKEKRQR